MTRTLADKILILGVDGMDPRIAKHFMDEGGVPFYAMDFVLQYPRTEDDEARPGGSIHILNFLYTDIYERGMTERVQAANDAALAYYAEQDKQKLAEEPITK